MSLSDRIRPNSEAAPWVIEEVRKLDSELALLRKICIKDGIDGEALNKLVSDTLARAQATEVEAAELRAQLTAGDDKVLRCAFCGEPYPEGTPTYKHEALAAHIKVCKVHPVGIENRRLTSALRQVSRLASRLVQRSQGCGAFEKAAASEIDQVCIAALNGEPYDEA